jgi:hypothetical protein
VGHCPIQARCGIDGVLEKTPGGYDMHIAYLCQQHAFQNFPDKGKPRARHCVAGRGVEWVKLDSTMLECLHAAENVRPDAHGLSCCFADYSRHEIAPGTVVTPV